MMKLILTIIKCRSTKKRNAILSFSNLGVHLSAVANSSTVKFYLIKVFYAAHSDMLSYMAQTLISCSLVNNMIKGFYYIDLDLINISVDKKNIRKI